MRSEIWEIVADAFGDLGGDEGIYVKWLNEKQISHPGEKLQFADFEWKKKRVLNSIFMMGGCQTW